MSIPRFASQGTGGQVAQTITAEPCVIRKLENEEARP